MLQGGVSKNLYQNWDKNGRIYYTDENGNKVKQGGLNLGDKLKAGLTNFNDWLNNSNPNSDAYKEKAATVLGLATAPLSLGTAVTTKIASGLAPIVGRQIAKTIASGISGGVAGGATMGGLEQGLKGQNPLKGVLSGGLTGGLAGGLGGLGLGQIGKKFAQNKLLNNSNYAKQYFDDYVEGLSNQGKDLAEYRGLTQGINKGADDTLYDQVAWHGSPYDFDKFSNDFIGSGEGAQAHGMGHYVALDKDVAQGYQSGLSYKNNAETGNYLGQPIEEIYNETYDLANRTKDKNLRQQYYDKTAMLEELMLHKSPEEVLETFTSEDYNLSPETIDWFKNEFMPNYKAAGTLYKVSIPDDDVFLREDALFKDQPEKVKDALFNYYQQSLGEYAPSNKEFMNNLTTDDIMSRTMADAKAQNINKDVIDLQKVRRDILLNNGIKGISYNGGVDGEARVIFNPDDIKILEKNGQLVNQLLGE